MKKKTKLQPAAEQAAGAVLISSHDEANAALVEYARAKRLCDRLQRELDEEVEHDYGLFYRECAGHDARAKAYEGALVEYARRTLAKLNAGKAKLVKSIRLALGKVRFTREDDRLIFRLPTSEIMDNLRRLGFGHLIKSKDYVEADDLRTLPAELHAQIGFSIEPTPSVGKIELDSRQLSGHPELATAQ